jgi:hypothetical protein
MNEDLELIEIRQKIGAIRDFYVHLSVFGIVIAMLAVINLASGDTWWVQWPFLGWGIGLLAHALGAYGRDGRLGWLGGWLGPDWEQRKIEQLARKK